MRPQGQGERQDRPEGEGRRGDPNECAYCVCVCVATSLSLYTNVSLYTDLVFLLLLYCRLQISNLQMEMQKRAAEAARGAVGQ